jgi:hypothetical protein
MAVRLLSLRQACALVSCCLFVFLFAQPLLHRMRIYPRARAPLSQHGHITNVWLSLSRSAMEQQLKCLAFRGTLLHAPGKPGSVQVLSDHLVIVDKDGYIVHLAPSGEQGPCGSDNCASLGTCTSAAALLCCSC